MNVFTYGTLMFPEVWRSVVGQALPSVAGTLPGHRVLRMHGVVYPGMIRGDETDSAQGVVYLNVDDRALAELDCFEEACYRRELVAVQCTDGTVRHADAYLVTDEYRHALLNERWTADQFKARGDLARFLGRYSGFDRVRSGE